MKIAIAFALICSTSTVFAAKPAAPIALTKAQAKQRINEAIKFASKKSAFSGDPGAIFTGWGAGSSKAPVVTKTGSVRLSSGDEQSPQFSNYFVTFGKRTNKPTKLVFINAYD